MQSYYSVYGTRITLLLEDELAENYNRAAEAFAVAQLEFLNTNNRPWTGKEALWIEWTVDERRAWNEFAEFMNSMIKLNGGSLNLKQEDLPSSKLIKQN